VGTRVGLDTVEKREILTLPGLELRPLGLPARSQSLYLLSYPGSFGGRGADVFLSGFLNSLSIEFLLNNIYKSSPYLTGNTLHLHYKAQPVNAVWGNSRCLL
jgi:hypothetical protein